VAPAHTWTWVEFPGSACRDGSPAGIAVNWEPASTKVVIFLEGGWACWEQQLCAMNPAHVDDNTKHGIVSGDLWNRTNPDNPFAAFNQIYVPYCTGDFHAGANPAGTVAGLPGTQHFTGYSNLELFLDRIVATFPQPAQVVLTGASSGGVAVYFNAAHVARRFGGKGLVAIDDCGPPQVDTVFRPCLQSQLRRQWALDETVLAECGAGCPDHDNYALDLVRHFLRGSGNVGGYVDSVRDGPVVSLYGWPIGDCSGAPPLTADAYESGLGQFRSSGAGFGGPFSTFYLPGTGHCWYRTDFFTTTVAGTRLVDWTRAVLAGQSLQVGP
jgi:hypothetical protein